MRPFWRGLCFGLRNAAACWFLDIGPFRTIWKSRGSQAAPNSHEIRPGRPLPGLLPDAGYLFIYRNPLDVLLSLMRRKAAKLQASQRQRRRLFFRLRWLMM